MFVMLYIIGYLHFAVLHYNVVLHETLKNTRPPRQPVMLAEFRLCNILDYALCYQLPTMLKVRSPCHMADTGTG